MITLLSQILPPHSGGPTIWWQQQAYVVELRGNRIWLEGLSEPIAFNLLGQLPRARGATMKWWLR